jgi:hypothetical protein
MFLLADIDEGLELLGELTVQEKEGYLYLHVSPAAHDLLGEEAPDKDSHLTQSAAKPTILIRRSALKTDRHPKDTMTMKIARSTRHFGGQIIK